MNSLGKYVSSNPFTRDISCNEEEYSKTPFLLIVSIIDLKTNLEIFFLESLEVK